MTFEELSASFHYDVILVNVICFPATFILLASMSLFHLFCFIDNKKQQKFY